MIFFCLKFFIYIIVLIDRQIFDLDRRWIQKVKMYIYFDDGDDDDDFIDLQCL